MSGGHLAIPWDGLVSITRVPSWWRPLSDFVAHLLRPAAACSRRLDVRNVHHRRPVAPVIGDRFGPVTTVLLRYGVCLGALLVAGVTNQLPIGE